jgi:dihydrofolate reductase
MRKLSVFNNVSLDGYYTDANNDYSWAHEGANDPELMEFTKSNAQGANALVFGRVTYELMAAWWPTAGAATAMPEVANGMNAAPKYVFSRTLVGADWSNTTLFKSDPATEIARLKQTPRAQYDHPGVRHNCGTIGGSRSDRRNTNVGLPGAIGFGEKPVCRRAWQTMVEFAAL